MRLLLVAHFFAAGLLAESACPENLPSAGSERSATTADLVWSSSARLLGRKKLCLEQRLSVSNPDVPQPVAWPAAAILEARIARQFVAAFCCFEKVHAGNRNLTYGSPPRTVPAHAYAGHFEDEGEYGDLIEPDAKIRQVSLTGRVWNGERFIQLDLDLRASASNAYYKESMYQFVITDQSSEPLTVEWDLMTKIKPERSFFKESPKGQAFRQSTYVFYTDGRPAPAPGVIQVRTADGKSLGHFAADGFVDRGSTKRNSMSLRFR